MEWVNSNRKRIPSGGVYLALVKGFARPALVEKVGDLIYASDAYWTIGEERITHWAALPKWHHLLKR